MSQLSQMCLMKRSECNKQQNQQNTLQPLQRKQQSIFKIKIDNDFIITNFNRIFSNYEEDIYQSTDFSSSYKHDDILK